jgi:hypothetical protein
MAIQKCGVPCGWESHITPGRPTNRKLGGQSARTHTPSRRTPNGRLGVIYDPSWLEYTKMLPETGGCSHFLIEKSPKTSFLIKTFKDIILKHFLRNRFR